MKPVQILVADDHPIIRRGVRSQLEARRGWKVVAEAATAAEAVAKTKRLRPDIVVMDLSLGESSGLEATREIVATSPKTAVVVLSMHESAHAIREAIAAGARAYVSKSDADHDLVGAIRALLAGRAFFTSRAMQAMVAPARSDRGAEPPDPKEVALTPRQREIVRLLAEGRSNKEIAAALGISVRTAETHRANLMRRLRAPTLSHVVRYAVRHGIVAG